jgi:HrpA-like RNA helicase
MSDVEYTNIFSGETGCGKTTQVPQFLLDDEEIGPYSRIIVTQPRRLSAISVAERVAKERGETVGNIIGYNIRMEHRYTRSTQCLFVTPGVLLRKIASDPTLLEFSHVIIDEAHERDRFTEFLMIVLRDICQRRPSLKLVLMSATLHTDKISSYFGGVPQVHMGGSMFPVQEFFLEHALQFTGYTSNFRKLQDSSKAAQQPQYVCPLCKSKAHQFTSSAELATHVALCTGTTNMTDGLLTTNRHSTGSSISALQALVQNLRMSNVAVTAIPPAEDASPAVDFEIEESDIPDAGSEVSDEAIDEVIEANFNSSKFSRDTSATSAVAAPPPEPSTWASDFEGSEMLLRQYQGQWDDVYVDCDLIMSLINFVFDSEFCKSGSVLVFLPGWDDISTLHKLLSYSQRFGNNNVFKLIQLHSGIPRLEQEEVFKPLQMGQHKIILSTNIAETSITIDDVAVVIDSGKLKERIYDPHVKLSFLKTTWISRAAARQRVGRAGRTRPGVCFHLFSKKRCLGLEPFQESELLRMPLEELVLQTKTLGLAPGCREEPDSVTSFLAKALDPPHPLTTANAVKLLIDIGCFTDLEELTVIGKAISALPMDPKLGRAILIGCIFGCGPSLVTIATAMGYRDPFILPVSEQAREQCNAVKRQFAEGIPSDQICLLRATEHFSAAAQRLNYHKLAKYCDEHFLSKSTMNSLTDMTEQLARTMMDININVANHAMQRNNGNVPLLSALIGMCLYPNIAIRVNGASLFASEKGPKTKLHPSSVNSKFARFKGACREPLEIMGFDNLIAINMGVKSTPGSANLMMLNTTPLSVFALMLVCGSLRLVSSSSTTTPILPELDADCNDVGNSGDLNTSNENLFVDIDNWIRVRIDSRMYDAVIAARAVIFKSLQYILVHSSAGQHPQQQLGHQASTGKLGGIPGAMVQLPQDLLTCINMLAQVLVNEAPLCGPVGNEQAARSGHKYGGSSGHAK